MAAKKSTASELKSLIPDPNDRIKLDDFVTELLRTALTAIRSDRFWDSPPQVTTTSLQERLVFYESLSSDLLTACVLLGRWATDDQVQLLNKIFVRLSETTKPTSGLTYWNCLRWYPLSHLTYATGIAALSAGNYRVLRSVLLQPVYMDRSDTEPSQIVVQTESNMSEADDGFKLLPGHERKHVPRSEYMFETLKGPLDELLFLGDGYEAIFDEFEILSALVYADVTADGRGGRIWAPVGRFGWKRALAKYVERAKAEGANWPPLKLGFFSSKQECFDEVSKGFLDFLSRVSFY